MASPVNFFINEFVPTLPNSEFVNISDLVRQFDDKTPLKLPYTDKEESIKLLSGVIIENLCNTYRDTLVYKDSVMLWKKIIEPNDGSDDDVLARKAFAIHVSGRKLRIDIMRFIFAETQSMVVKNIITADERNWIGLVNLVIRHKEINEKIENFIEELGQVPSRDYDSDASQIKVTIVEEGPDILRGFVGFEEIFIHSKHFRAKIDVFKGDIDLLQIICKMDIVSVALHELAHLKIRRSAGQFNFHTPDAVTESGIGEIVHEFGAFTEKKIFGAQVDWFRSIKTVNIRQCEQFIDAVENNKPLPVGFITGTMFRIAASVGGADMLLSSDLC